MHVCVCVTVNVCTLMQCVYVHECSYNICRGHTEARRGRQWHARRESRKWTLPVGIGRMGQERVTRRNVTIYTCTKMSHPSTGSSIPRAGVLDWEKYRAPASISLSFPEADAMWLTASHSWRTAHFKLLFSNVMSQWGYIWIMCMHQCMQQAVRLYQEASLKSMRSNLTQPPSCIMSLSHPGQLAEGGIPYLHFLISILKGVGWSLGTEAKLRI